MGLITPGQSLSVKWRGAHSVVQQNIRRLKLDPTENGGAEISCWATFFDPAGLSVYIVRGFQLGGDMEAFLPTRETMWQYYFDVNPMINAGYAKREHYRKIFPRDFLMR